MSEQTTPTHEDLEHAFHAPQKVLARLPETTETKRALHHLEIARDYAYAAREKVRAEE